MIVVMIVVMIAVEVPVVSIVVTAVVIAVKGVVAAVVVAIPAAEVVAVIVSICDADVVPISRNPVAAVVVAPNPDIPRTRARRNVGHRPANINPKLGCLGRGCSKTQTAGNDCCTQNPFAKVFHNSSIPDAAAGS
jgi:hypothetical protein